jgi:hypothetical protein
MEALHRAFGREVAFFLVYVREAHPEDGWVLEENRTQGICIVDPTTGGEREQVARACADVLGLSIPVVIDDPDDRVARLYGGWPERLYLVGRDGRIVYQGGPGPFEFFPQELKGAIEGYLDNLPAATASGAHRS